MNNQKPLIKMTAKPFVPKSPFIAAEYLQNMHARSAGRRADETREPVKSFADVIPAADVAGIKSLERDMEDREDRTHRVAGIAVTAEVTQIPVQSEEAAVMQVDVHHDVA